MHLLSAQSPEHLASSVAVAALRLVAHKIHLHPDFLLRCFFVLFLSSPCFFSSSPCLCPWYVLRYRLAMRLCCLSRSLMHARCVCMCATGCQSSAAMTHTHTHLERVRHGHVSRDLQLSAQEGQQAEACAGRPICPGCCTGEDLQELGTIVIPHRNTQ